MNKGSKENITVAKDVWNRIWHKGNLELVDKFFAEDFVRHDPNRAELDRNATKEFIRKTRGAFPDLHFTIDDIFATDDKVVTHYHFEGTHLGDNLGFPTTKRKVKYSGIIIQRFSDGMIVEQWTEADLLSLFQELGIMPGNK